MWKVSVIVFKIIVGEWMLGIIGIASASYPFLRDVKCTNSEKYLHECSHEILQNGYCSRVDITCYSENIVTITNNISAIVIS